MEPDLKTRRRMLEQKIATFQAQGYDFWLEARAAEVQDPGPDSRAKKALADEIKRLETQSANAYAAAKRLQALLDELPAEEEKA